MIFSTFYKAMNFKQRTNTKKFTAHPPLPYSTARANLSFLLLPRQYVKLCRCWVGDFSQHVLLRSAKLKPQNEPLRLIIEILTLLTFPSHPFTLSLFTLPSLTLLGWSPCCCDAFLPLLLRLCSSFGEESKKKKDKGKECHERAREWESENERVRVSEAGRQALMG